MFDAILVSLADDFEGKKNEIGWKHLFEIFTQTTVYIAK